VSNRCLVIDRLNMLAKVRDNIAVPIPLLGLKRDQRSSGVEGVTL
jgi:hypothetical protein